MITLDELKAAKFQRTMHMKLAGGSAYFYACIDYPEISILDRYESKTRTVTRTYAVEGWEGDIADREQLLAVYNAVHGGKEKAGEKEE